MDSDLASSSCWCFIVKGCSSGDDEEDEEDGEDDSLQFIVLLHRAVWLRCCSTTAWRCLWRVGVGGRRRGSANSKTCHLKVAKEGGKRLSVSVEWGKSSC